MTNKEFYGDYLQIVAEGRYANIYYKRDDRMMLLANICDDNIFEAIDKWLNEECIYRALYKYEEWE